MRTSERLWRRLCAMGLSEYAGVGLQPLRPSRASRANGAWSWAAIDSTGLPLPLGSHLPMVELAAAARLVASLDSEVGDISIDVVSEDHPMEELGGSWTWTRTGQILLETAAK